MNEYEGREAIGDKWDEDKDFLEELKKWTGCFPERILEVEKL